MQNQNIHSPLTHKFSWMASMYKRLINLDEYENLSAVERSKKLLAYV